MREIKRATLVCVVGLTLAGCLAEESDSDDDPAGSGEASEPARVKVVVR